MPLPPLEPVRRVRLVHEDESQRKAIVRRAMVAVAERCAWSGSGLGVDLGEDRGKRDAARVALFKTITETRGMTPSYSTCGELVGFCLASMGLRDERILNKDDDDLDGVVDAKQRRGIDSPGIAGQYGWQMGKVITMLMQGSMAAGCWVAASQVPARLPRAGDCVLIGENGGEHVFVVVTDLAPWPDGAFEFASVDAGQADAGGQCTKRFPTNFLKRVNGRWYVARGLALSGRPLIGWIDLDKVPLPGPALVPASFTEGCEPWVPLFALRGRTHALSRGWEAPRRQRCGAQRRCSNRGSSTCERSTSTRGSTRSSAPR